MLRLEFALDAVADAFAPFVDRSVVHLVWRYRCGLWLRRMLVGGPFQQELQRWRTLGRFSVAGNVVEQRLTRVLRIELEHRGGRTVALHV